MWMLQGFRVIEEPGPEGTEGEKVMFERQRAWCCSTTPEPAICGISRIWVMNTMRRQGIASRMLDCLRCVWQKRKEKNDFNLVPRSLTLFLFFFFTPKEQLHIRFVPEQRRNRVLRPDPRWKTLCHAVLWHFPVFGL